MMKVYNFNDFTGLTKEEALETLTRLEGEKIDAKLAKHIITTMRGIPSSTLISPTNYRVGDVYMSHGLRHPALIFSIRGDQAFAVLMTTNPEYKGVIFKSNSRFFPDSYITATIVTIPLNKLVLYGIYDCHTDILKLRKELKRYYRRLGL